MYGVHLAHKIGDLVRIRKSVRLHSSRTARGSLGVVVERPEEKQKSLFIKVYIFKNNREEWLAPSEMDIISNIDE
jgi:predicted nucleotidyltransferase